MLDTLELGAAVVMLNLLQWDAESGGQEAVGILAECWTRLQVELQAGDKRAIAIMAAWSRRRAGVALRGTSGEPSRTELAATGTGRVL
jgi:hypothetical protein